MTAPDLADVLEELSPAERQAIFDSLDEETAAETIAELDKRLQTQVVEKLTPAKAADILEEMSPDEAAVAVPLAGGVTMVSDAVFTDDEPPDTRVRTLNWLGGVVVPGVYPA